MGSPKITGPDKVKHSFELANLVDLLRWRAALQPDLRVYTFLEKTREISLTFGALDLRARAIGSYLHSLGATDERVLLLFPSGLDYIAAFFGCLYARAVAVPAYPPRPNRTLDRLQSIAHDARPGFVLTTAGILGQIEPLMDRMTELKTLPWLTVEAIENDLAEVWELPIVEQDTLAFLQYTSGSTAKPKGVMVTHQNLLHNERMIQNAFQQAEQSVIVGWLPLFHDMGMIGNVLQPLYVGAHSILLPPIAFLQNPSIWLETISRYRATTSGGPNFAYDLCVRKVTPEQRSALRLDCWDVAFNGSEPVDKETMDRFTLAFEPCGFRREAFYPCYGLAEATLFVSGGQSMSGPTFRYVDRTALDHKDVAPHTSEDRGARTLVSCGRAWLEQRIRIVDPDSCTLCPPGRVGEIWVLGQSVARGYWNRPEESKQTFKAHLADTGEGPFLRTGDLGFLDGEELYVTGRLKDLIIIRGRNHYPEDIERSVQQTHHALRPGGTAAFSVEIAGEERLVVVQEIEKRHNKANLDEIIGAIRQAVAEVHQLGLYAVVLVKSGSVPKTSSGKVQRHACRAAFLAGTLNAVDSRILSAPDDYSDASPSDDISREDLLAISSPQERRFESERCLLGLVGRVLRLPPSQLPSHQPLTRLGLDSLKAIELQNRIESSLGIFLDMSSLLQDASISQLASEVATSLTPSTPAAVDLSGAGNKGEEQLLSYGQQRLWFLDQLEPGSTLYNITAAVRLTGELDISALEQSINEIVRRHESLRTSFKLRSGVPVQVISESVWITLPVEQIAAADEEESEALLKELIRAERQQPFDLSVAPLIRVRLARISGREHVLVLVMHHIISDGWSMGVFARELAALYEAFRERKPSPLAELPAQYSDYARWQRQRLQGEALENQLSYWKGHLSGKSFVLDLPTDRPRPKAQTFNGGRLNRRMSADLARGIKQLSKREAVTDFTVLLGVFKVMLQRYSSQRDIIVGTPIANRNRAEVEGLIGFFVNTLAIATEVRPEERFKSLLARVKEGLLGAYAHQDLPFEKLIEELQPERDLSRSPIVQVMMALQPAVIESVRMGGLKLSSIGEDAETAKFDLTLFVTQGDDWLEAGIEYNSDLFDEITIRQMLEHYEALLASALANPEQRVSRLTMLTDVEQHQLWEWNRTSADYESGVCIHELVERQARRTPDKVAVVRGIERLTYRELDRRANQLGHYLKARGVGIEDAVGVCVERGLNMLVAVLGVMKAGAAYLPLDPSYPKPRLEYMLEDSRAPLVLTQQVLVDSLPAHTAELVCMDTHWSDIARHSRERVESGVTDHNLAYVIFTSGSTGRPKGVAIEHRSTVTLINWSKEFFDAESLSSVLASTSICFDLSVFEMMVPLSVGGKVVIAANALELPDLAAKEEVRLINTVPSAIAELVRLNAVPPGVRTVNLAGEPLKNVLVQQVYEANAAVERVVNLYGPTEDTTYSTVAVVERSHSRQVNIGRPLANTQVYILDNSKEMSPVGVPGELHISGEGLARGYLNQPEMTAEKFIPNPFGGGVGARLYQTGDLTRLTRDGEIEYLGRIDHQVKVRGYRIELGEIETALCQHEAVSDAAVVAREDASSNRVLVGYIVRQAGIDVSPAELKAYLKARVPDYMVPPALMILEELPLTANGKVDRRALPEPEGIIQQGGYLRPQDAHQEIISGIWEEVLGIERVGIHDNFFELGGHSLLATQVISRVRSAFGVEVALRNIFHEPTVAGLAARVKAAQTSGRRAAPPVRRVDRGGELGLSFAQQRLWFIDQLEPDSSAYNMSMGLRLRGELNKEALQWSLNEIVRRHEALRTSFESRGGRPVQQIASEMEVAIQQSNLREMSEQQREEEVSRVAQEEAARPFDLSRAPLMRVRLMQVGQHEYVLIVSMHHIISDGWSMGVMVKEFARLYEAYARGEGSPLEEPGVQYADYAAWQRGWLRGEELERQVDYWRWQLNGVEQMELPTDYTRGAGMSRRGARVSFELSEEVSRGLKEVSRREGVTLFMSLLAGMGVMLSKYSGQEDVAVGTAVANRTREEVEGVIGFFVNTLVMRLDLNAELTFSQLLRQARDVALGAYTHQDMPFEKLVEEINPDRDFNRSPLFQVMLLLQNAGQQDLQLPGLRLDAFRPEFEIAKYELTFELTEKDGKLLGEVSYMPELYEAETIRRMVSHFSLALERIIAEPDRQISELPLLTEAERQQVLAEWNQTRAEYPQECVHELFEQQVGRTPEAVAVEYDGEQMSYEGLNGQANRLAHYLRDRGVGPGSLVGICLERSVEMIVSILGILKAGGAYVPLDTDYPAERLNYMIEDARVKTIITNEELAGNLPAHEAICLDRERAKIERASRQNPPARVPLESLAYVIYTSGSSGRPKGVMVTHRSLVNHMSWMRWAYGLSEDDQVLQKTPLSFDASVWEILLPLMSGAKLVMAKPGGHQDGRYLVEAINRHRITTLQVVPTMLKWLVEKEGMRGCESLRRVYSGGEELSVELQEKYFEQMGGELINLYGPTEATIQTVVWKCERGSKRRRVPIGRPIWNTRVYIVDGRMNPTPIGVEGELYIGGEGVARGYVGRADLTGESFIADGLSGERGGRLYRTGDRARYKEDGTIEFLGRAEGQKKIRGYRIEMGEIERVLNEQEGVRESIVVMRDGGEEKQLVGYVVEEEGKTATADELRERLRKKLPEYMVPSQYVKINQVPLTANGKVDRRALPEPEGISQQGGYVGPQDAHQEIISGIWEEVLGLERVGIHDNFFELGGHSLLATQVVSRVKSAFGVEVALREMFEEATVAGLAEKVKAAQAAGKESSPPVTRVERGGELGLSFAQQRLWFMDQLEPDSSAYNVSMGLRLMGELNKEALQWSLNEIVRRHEALRTSFPSRGGRPVQQIASEMEVVIQQSDLRQMGEAEREEEVRRVGQEEAARPFDLSRAPLMRVRLMQVGQHEHVLIVSMHHIISDGWSMGVMVKEFARLYEAYVRGEKARLEEPGVQYADYAVWQREWLRGEELERQVGYWREQLRDVKQMELPTDYSRGVGMSRRGAKVSFELSEGVSRGLKEVSRREGVTLFMSLLAGMGVMLSKYSGQEDVAVGTAVANRTREEVEGVIGFFVNTLVMRVGVRGELSFAEMLREVRRVVLEGYEHQEVPFEKVVEEVQPERDVMGMPLIQVMLVLQNMEQVEMEMAGLRVEEMRLESDLAKFDLLVLLNESDRKIVGELTYACDLYEAETAKRMIEHLRVVLEAMVKAPEERISNLSLLTEAERQEMLVEWNQTRAEYPQECVHELFEQQVGRTPEAVAVKYEGKELTYAELNRRANQLGRYLIDLGVGPERRVGLCVERSIEMVVGILGILKAGGVYVPLDLSHPMERLAYMLEDAQIEVLLTQQRVKEQLPPYAHKIVELDGDWEQIARHSSNGLTNSVTPQNLAYMIYTSGSTGRPKGALVTHANVARLFHHTYDWFKFDERDVWTLFHSYAFDFSVWELWGALLYGGRLVVVPYWVSRSPEDFLRLLVSEGVTILNQTPSAFQQLMRAEEVAGIDDGLSLRAVIFGGEALELHSLRSWFERHQERPQLVNMYGITETTVHVTHYPIRPADSVESNSSSKIGRAIPDLSVYAVDESMQPVPIGVPGELYVGGAGVARGYWGKADLTAERFLPNPYAENGGERLYRTGDQVRWRPNAHLDFLGRIDQQVKIRGYRIELGEIEAVLREHQAVKQSVVVVRKDKPGEPRLVAYVVEEEGKTSTADELRDQLREKLPEYMVPSQYVKINQVPLTANGKVDRRALPEPEGTREEGGYVGPQDAHQEIITGIWEEVLGIERVGIHDNFFELGGHSLLATQVVSRVRSVFGAEMALREMFEEATVAGLAEKVKAAQWAGREVVPRVTRVERGGELELSFAQQRLWFMDQLEPDSSAYNMSMGLRLMGELNKEALQRSLNEIVRRHEALRTSFPSRGGRPVQQIASQMEVAIQQSDLREMSEQQREREVSRVAQEEAGRPFDLNRAPLMRVRLMQVGQHEHVLIVSMHHIISDGWSMGVMVKEFARLYEAYVRGEQAGLEELEVQYADYAVWQREWLRGEELERELSYWREQLRGVKQMELPTDYARGVGMSRRGARVSFELSEEVSRGLKEVSRREGVTLFMSLLAGMGVMLSKYSGQEDVAVGTAVANRTREEVEGVIGFFVNTLVMRVGVRGELSFAEMLREVRRVVLEGYEHQEVPFEKVVEEVQPERDVMRTPLIQVMLVLQDIRNQEIPIKSLEITRLPDVIQTSKEDLTFYFLDEGSFISGSLVFNIELFTEDRAKNFVKSFQRILAAACNNINILIDDLPWYDDQELDAMAAVFSESLE